MKPNNTSFSLKAFSFALSCTATLCALVSSQLALAPSSNNKLNVGTTSTTSAPDSQSFSNESQNWLIGVTTPLVIEFLINFYKLAGRNVPTTRETILMVGECVALSLAIMLETGGLPAFDGGKLSYGDNWIANVGLVGLLAMISTLKAEGLRNTSSPAKATDEESQRLVEVASVPASMYGSVSDGTETTGPTMARTQHQLPNLSASIMCG